MARVICVLLHTHATLLGLSRGIRVMAELIPRKDLLLQFGIHQLRVRSMDRLQYQFAESGVYECLRLYTRVVDHSETSWQT